MKPPKRLFRRPPPMPEIPPDVDRLSPDEMALMLVIDEACRRSPDGRCRMSDLELGQAAGFTGDHQSIELHVRRLINGYTVLEDGSIVDHGPSA